MGVWNKETDKVCNGALINDLYILTSAECSNVTYQADEELTVTLQNEKLNVERVLLPPNHMPNIIPRQNDVMLLRLKVPLDMTLHVPICLPEASLFVHQGENALIMTPILKVRFWGQTSINTRSWTKNIGVKIKGRQCSFRRRVRGAVRSILVREDLFLCAGEVSTPFCSRTPGNLLVMMRHGWFTLLGLSTTHELFPMCKNSMGLFSDVLLLREWIRSNTQDASQCQFA